MQGVEICQRVDALKTARSTVESIWNDVEKYIMPLRVGNMYVRELQESALKLIRDDVYDSTGIFAAQRMSNAMHGTITNPAVLWRKRQYKSKKLNEDVEAKDWLEQADEIEWGELYESNFDPEISSAYQDLVGLGNCFMSVEAENDSPKDWAGFNFSAIPIKESFFERDHRGDIYRYYRWFQWRSSEIKSKWPDIKLPDAIEKDLAAGGKGEPATPDRRWDIIYAIYVRPGKKSAAVGQVQAARNRPVGFKFILRDTKEEIGAEGGFYQMPIFHCPWEKTSGSIWGHGPGMIMAPTVKYINFWLELEDMAIRKLIDPPVLTMERAIIGDMDLAPGGLTVVRRLDGIKTFLSEGRIDFSKMSLKELRDSVKEAFHNDELQLRDSPQMSATESQIRYELMNRVLGPTMGRIQSSLLSKILDRTFKTLLRNKQFPKIPASVRQTNAQMKVIYTGALVRAQMTDEVAAVERWIAQIGAIAKVSPQVLNVVDFIQVARDMAIKLGISAKLLRSTKDVQELVRQQQQVAAAQAQQALRAQQGQADQAQGDGKAALAQGQQAQPSQAAA